jgi:hypothetical protein
MEATCEGEARWGEGMESAVVVRRERGKIDRETDGNEWLW